jgi:hypothetical protein
LNEVPGAKENPECYQQFRFSAMHSFKKGILNHRFSYAFLLLFSVAVLHCHLLICRTAAHEVVKAWPCTPTNPIGSSDVLIATIEESTRIGAGGTTLCCATVEATPAMMNAKTATEKPMLGRFMVISGKPSLRMTQGRRVGGFPRGPVPKAFKADSARTC